MSQKGNYTNEIAQAPVTMIIDPQPYGLEHNKALAVREFFTPMIDVMVKLENEVNEVLALKEQHGYAEEVITKATEAYKKLVKARTATAKIHKEVKATNLKEGRFIDSHKNTQVMIGDPLEKAMKAIKDHAENLERERIKKVKEDRTNKLLALDVVESDIPDMIGIMTDGMFENLLLGAQAAFDKRLEEAKEEARLEQLRIDQEAREKAEKEAKRQEELRIAQEAAAEAKKAQEAAEAAAKKVKDEAEAKLQAERDAKAKVEAQAKEEKRKADLAAQKARQAMQKAEQSQKNAEKAKKQVSELKKRNETLSFNAPAPTGNKPKEEKLTKIAQDRNASNLIKLKADLIKIKDGYSFHGPKHESFKRRLDATLDRILVGINQL